MNINRLLASIGIFPKSIVIEGGIKVLLRNTPLSKKMRRNLMCGGYERAERKLISLLIQPDDRVLELGGSLGIVTSLIAHSVLPSGVVFSAEPNLSLRPSFNKQLSFNGCNVDLVSALVCPIWSECVPDHFLKMGFNSSVNSLSSRASFQGGNDVKWITLKTMAIECGLNNPTALVIDIEGAEDVWCDFPPNFPDSIKKIIIEIHPNIIGEIKAAKTMQALFNEGFRIHSLCASVYAFTR